MGSDAMICIPSFIKIGSAIHKLMRGRDIQKQREHGDRIRLLLFSQNKKSRLKNRTLHYVSSCISSMVTCSQPFCFVLKKILAVAQFIKDTAISGYSYKMDVSNLLQCKPNQFLSAS
jgi:hypothetical protein